MKNEGNAMMISKEECVTSEDRELLCNLAHKMAQATGERPGLLRDINKLLLEYDERKLRFVYFFANGLK